MYAHTYLCIYAVCVICACNQSWMSLQQYHTLSVHICAYLCVNACCNLYCVHWVCRRQATRTRRPMHLIYLPLNQLWPTCLQTPFFRSPQQDLADMHIYTHTLHKRTAYFRLMCTYTHAACTRTRTHTRTNTRKHSLYISAFQYKVKLRSNPHNTRKYTLRTVHFGCPVQGKPALNPSALWGS
jgi:hypothetical protein